MEGELRGEPGESQKLPRDETRDREEVDEVVSTDLGRVGDMGSGIPEGETLSLILCEPIEEIDVEIYVGDPWTNGRRAGLLLFTPSVGSTTVKRTRSRVVALDPLTSASMRLPEEPVGFTPSR